jgi:hypothetical protein
VDYWETEFTLGQIFTERFSLHVGNIWDIK